MSHLKFLGSGSLKGIILSGIIFCAAFGLISCGSRSKSEVDRLLLPGTRTPEFSIKKGKGRWQFVSTDGFARNSITLTECPNAITEPNPETPYEEIVRDYGYKINLNDLASSMYPGDFIYSVFLPRYYSFFESGSDFILLLGEGGQREGEQKKESEPAGERESEPDITAFKDNYLFNLNRYVGVVIADVSDEKEPYIEHIIPVEGYPVEMFVMGRYAVIGIAGYTPDYRYGDDEINRLFATKSAVQVWDIKVPEDADLISEEEVQGALIQLLRKNDIAVAISVSDSKVYITSFKIKDDGEIEKRTEISLNSEPYIFYNLRYTRALISEDTLIVGVLEIVNCSGDRRYYCLPLWQTKIHIFEIYDNGDLGEKGTVIVPGVMDDERRMDVKDGILRVISGDVIWGRGRRMSAYATTIDMNGPVVLDSKEFGVNERLFATAFSDNLGYAVTFRRIDPLFVIDFSDPKDIKILGSLEVLGWAEQLYPYGNRLLALGPENWKTALSLYDVSDPTNPQMLSRLYFGDRSSASEVYNDYKAFTFVPSMNLILFPYTEMKWWMPLNNYVQIVDFSPDSLTARGKVDIHGVVKRVLPLSDKKFIAVSEKALSIIDIGNRENPSKISELRLQRNVKKIIGSKNIALLLTDSNYPWMDYCYLYECYYSPNVTTYYRYEIVDTSNPVMKPIGEVLTYKPVVGVEKVSDDTIIVKTATHSDVTYYKLLVSRNKIEVSACLKIDRFLSLQETMVNGKLIVDTGIINPEFINPEFYYYYWSSSYWLTRNKSIVAFLIDSETLEVEKALLVNKDIYHYTGNYPTYSYWITSVGPLLFADSENLYFSAYSVEGQTYRSSSTSYVKPYVIKINYSNFTKEFINLPEFPIYSIYKRKILTLGVGNLSLYEISSDSPKRIAQMKVEKKISGVFKTDNFIILEAYDGKEHRLTLESYSISESGFEKVSEMKEPYSLYPDLCAFENLFTSSLCGGPKNTAGDYIVFDSVTFFYDPYALRKNVYCLDFETCRGNIYGTLVLKADSLSLENAITITSSQPTAQPYFTGDKLLIPRGLMGMEVIEEIGKPNRFQIGRN